MAVNAKAPLLLQWKFHGMSAYAADLIKHLWALDRKPLVALLQETKGKGPGIEGYRSYELATIRYAIISDPATSVVIQQTALYVRKATPHCQVPIVSTSTDVPKVVAVRVSLGRRTLVVALTYVRPQLQGASFDWMQQLRARYPPYEVLIDGDFNAISTTWEFRVTNIRGCNLEESAEDAKLILVNDLSYPTRLEKSRSQLDTLPDLTWVTPSTVSL